MRIAFVGTEDEFRSIEPAMQTAHGLQLAAIVPTGSSDWQHVTPAVCTDFDSMLADSNLDVLLLAGPVAQRSERLRATVQSGHAAVVWLPLDTSATAYHEAGCLANDSRLVVLPWWWRAMDPAFRRLLELADPRQFGKPCHVQIQFRGPAGPGRELAFGVYAELADLLRRLLGDLVEVTAIGDATRGSVRVHHRTQRGAAGEIAIAPGAEPVVLTIAVQFESGIAQLQFAPVAGTAGSLNWKGNAGAGQLPGGPFPHAACLSEGLRGGDDAHGLPNWSDATRAAELAECAWLSLERRRAIDVHHESHTELTQFKARMTTVGCGLVWVAVLLLFLVAAGEALRIPGMRYILVGLAGLLGLFLVLQLLRAIVPPGEVEGRESREEK
jgi:predicted dehydrogenase